MLILFRKRISVSSAINIKNQFASGLTSGNHFAFASTIVVLELLKNLMEKFENGDIGIAEKNVISLME
jgi:hypothetical protein